MREFSQMNGIAPAIRRWMLPPGGGFRWVWVAAWLAWVPGGAAQTLKLGLFDLYVSGSALVAYDSNVDDEYPDEADSNLSREDFYWMPGLSVQSQSAAMSPKTTLSMAAAYNYMDYFTRSDLDTEVYNASLNFQTVQPRLTLGGLASIDYSIESDEDEYMPGGVTRDPTRTDTASAFANFNYRKFRAEFQTSFERERHDEEEYQTDDQDETIVSAAAYLDLFTWGSVFYSWENDVTTLVQPEPDVETDETTKNFGLSGSIPLSWLAHPKISYSVGFESEEKETDGEEGEDPTWEPTHTITASDELQLSKTILLSGTATWEDTEEDDEVTFEYNVKLAQQLGTRAEHFISFSQEPQDTFGSNADTETTTYGYGLSIDDLFVYNLSFTFGATYEEETPLGVEDALTEKTTTIDWGLTHKRQITRKLSRALTYSYSYEDSNFHDDGAKLRHIVTYGFNYDF